ncbi:MAG: HEPN domain-containing protein [Dehalococcoidia bacterium]|nr:HEPN domain-containing protein [Dehalococcoidia bacterium]
MADQMLSDARLLRERGHMSSAADRAYYAMFHAAHAALAASGFAAPRTHKGLRSQFGQQLVSKGAVEREYSKDLTKAFEIRLESTYEAFAEVDPRDSADLVDRAERFVGRIKMLVGEAT